MSEQSLSYVLEAVLLAAGRPVSVDQMLELFEESQRPSVEEVKTALEELAGRCVDRACELREVASGWRMQVRAQYADVVSRLWQERPSRYSRALLDDYAARVLSCVDVSVIRPFNAVLDAGFAMCVNVATGEVMWDREPLGGTFNASLTLERAP